MLGSLYPGRPKTPGVRTDDPRLPPVTVPHVLAAIAQTFDVSEDDLLSKRNDKRLSWARKLAMYLAREETGASYPSLGRDFGGRNHTTVMTACRSVKERIDRDPTAQVDLTRVRSLLLDVRAGADAPADGPQDDRRG